MANTSNIKRITVKNGDSFWGIAQRELGDGSRYKEVADANGGLGTVIHPGDVLTINLDASDASKSSSTTATQNAPKTSPKTNSTSKPANNASSDNKIKNVTVKAGDSFWAIAQRELGDGNRWKEVADANGGANRVLQPGDIIKIKSVTTPKNSDTAKKEQVNSSNTSNAKKTNDNSTSQKIDNIDFSKYGPLNYSGNASPSVVNSSITGGHKTYQVGKNMSQSDYDYLVYQICGESGNDYSDMLGVGTTILNRMETGGAYGSTVEQVLSIGYWPWGRTYLAYAPGGQYANTSWGQEKIAKARSVVSDMMNGVRAFGNNSNVYYYGGDGTHNYFSDHLITG